MKYFKEKVDLYTVFEFDDGFKKVKERRFEIKVIEKFVCF